MHKKIVLVVPCFNEAGRIEMPAFSAAGANVGFVFVDDGSRDNTVAVIDAGKSADAKVIRLPRNCGKAEAVRQGMLYIAAHPEEFLGVEMVGFWDADLATPLAELSGLVNELAESSGKLDAVLGSRVKRLGAKINRSTKRHILGRLFATIADTLLGLAAYDTQCGAKLFRAEVLSKAFSEPFVSRWVFDLEIILRLGSDRISEHALANWQDVRGSKLNIPMASIRILRDLWVIKRRYKV